VQHNNGRQLSRPQHELNCSELLRKTCDDCARHYLGDAVCYCRLLATAFVARVVHMVGLQKNKKR
jgi:hypothetical protein